MCTGAEAMMMGGTVLGGYSRMAQGSAQASLAEADARYEIDAAAQQAEMIQRAARREKGAARAATAASGARIDEFALGAEQEIGMLAEQDAAMTILSGDRRARALRFSGQAAKRAGRNEFTSSLFSAAGTGYGGWKGGQKKVDTPSFYDGTTGDFAFQD